MRIIHTSDWHLGHILYGYDRSREQKSMLSQIEEIVKTEKPDALVVSGDVYHTGQPSAAVQKMFTEAVMRMHDACPEMEIVITAGNHDSASKHEVSRILWETQKGNMIGSVDKNDLDKLIVEVSGKGFVIAIPYVNERSVPEGFCQSLLDKVAERNTGSLPVVISAHTTVDGSNFTGHEDIRELKDIRELSVGGIDSVGLEEFGEGYDYIALGHIHKPQTIAGSRGRVRYCGTPLPVSFDETYEHSVSVVEIASRGAAPQIREVAVTNSCPLVNIPSSGYRKWEEVEELLKDFPKDNPAYIRLNVEVEDSLPPDAVVEARSILSGGLGLFCTINARRSTTGKSDRRALSVSEFRAMEPLEVARLYAEDMGVTFTDDLAALFREAEKEVKDDRSN